MDDLSFDHPKMLQLLWALPVLGAFYLRALAKRRHALMCFATSNLHPALLPSVSTARRLAQAILTMAAGGMLAIAAAGPRWGTHPANVPMQCLDIMFVLDVSNSMLAEDVVPNRLQRAKLDIKEMLEVLPGDRVGLITFAGTSTLTCPLTVDYGSFRLALEGVDRRSTPRGGTNIGDAVRHAADSFSDDVKDHKAIIVISDGGETDESYAIEASRTAFEERGIPVFTVGIGDPTEEARVPLARGDQRTYLEYQGHEVRTKLEPALLQSVAAVTEAAYFSNPDFRPVYDRIRSKVAPREYRALYRETRYARFHWFAGLALVLLTFETFMTDRKVVTR